VKTIVLITGLLLALLSSNLFGKSLIFPPAALPDLTKLGPARIETRWKPRTIPDGYFPTVEGYYVIYNHENLSLYFGPVDNEQEAIQIQKEMDETRNLLVSKNSSLSTSTVGRVKIDFGGEPPTNQSGAPPPGGFQPVRILSGNNTLELGKEEALTENSTGSPSEEPVPSDFGLGGGSAEKGDPIGDSETGGEDETSTSAGSGSAGTEPNSPDDPPGNGILNVLTPEATPGSPSTGQGTPSASPAELASNSGQGSEVDANQGNSAGQESESSSETPGDPPTTPGELAATDRSATGSDQSGKGEGSENNSSPTDSPTGPQGSGSSQSPPAPPEKVAPALPEVSLSDLLSGTPGNKSGTENGSPPSGQQSDPATPPTDKNGESGEASAEEEADTEIQSSPGNQTAAAESTEKTESAESPSSEPRSELATDAPAANSDSSESSAASESETKEASSEQPAEASKETKPVEQPPETTTTKAEPPPTPPSLVSLEMENNEESATSAPTTISINQLLKGNWGSTPPLVPPDDPNQQE
jgi:hypothetical protein